MKNLKKLVLTGIATIVAATSFGQLTLSGEYRPRAEYRHGYKSVANGGQADAFFIDQRTRLTLDYKVKDYEFFFQLQDVRAWGSEPQLGYNDATNALTIHQAWAKINMKEHWGLKLGRQEISYDDQRIFGAVGWAQQARSHDAAILSYESDKFKLHVGAAYNQIAPGSVGVDYSAMYNAAKNKYMSYRDMHFLHFNMPIGEKIKLSLLALNIGQQVDYLDVSGVNQTSMQYVQTYGTHLKFDFDKIKFSLNGYYQGGSAPVNPAKPVSAYLFGVDASYQAHKMFSVGLGYEAQSGTSNTDTTGGYNSTSLNFTPYFGTNHKFNGFMDYFYVGSGHMNAGLQDAYLKFKFKKDIWTVGLDMHVFMTGLGVKIWDQQGYIDDQREMGEAGATPAEMAAVDQRGFHMRSYLGTELDLSIGTKINKSVALKIGYSQMFSSETLAHLKGTNWTHNATDHQGQARNDQMNNWGYVMVIIKPTFLIKKKD
ncbi:MAG: alginate export family protein [Crocinitomicaceae bacterium]|nr:alginate export family protein [Crocinitomicaceae bacterium]